MDLNSRPVVNLAELQLNAGCFTNCEITRFFQEKNESKTEKWKREHISEENNRKAFRGFFVNKEKSEGLINSEKSNEIVD